MFAFKLIVFFYFFFNLFDRQRDRDKGKGCDFSSGGLLLNGHKSQCWTSLKSLVRNSVQVSYMDDMDQGTCVNIFCIPYGHRFKFWLFCFQSTPFPRKAVQDESSSWTPAPTWET